MVFATFDQVHEPAQAFVKDGGLQTVADRLAFLVRGNQPRLTQQRQVVRHRRFAQRKRVGEFARRVVTFPEQIEQASASRIIQRTEEHIHEIFRYFDKYRNNARKNYTDDIKMHLHRQIVRLAGGVLI